MQITKKQNGDLNAIITIEVKPEDYQPRVDKTIKNYTKTASIPGFRPGHVPAGIIKKRLGKEILVEELNRILGEELVNYLRENKIDVLGSPLPVQKQEELSFEEGKNFSFDYEIGIAPEVNVKLPSESVPYNIIKVDDKMIDDDINEMRRRYGKFSNPEAAEMTSVLYGDFNELDENGEIKAGGNNTTTTLSIEMIKNEEEQQKFIGAKKDDVIRFNPMNAVRNETEVSAMLKLDKKAEALNSDYNFRVKTVNKIEKAEINQEFFDKVFGEGVVNSEEEFRNKIREGIASYFEKESDKKFQKDIKELILDENNIQLPDDFLKRLLKERQETKIDGHNFEHEYFHMAQDLKWDLIQNKIAAEQSLKITNEELIDTARIMISQQYAQYGMAPPEMSQLDEIVKDYLKKDDNDERLSRSLLGHKVFDYLKKNLKLNMQELPYEQFIEKLKEKTSHEVQHH
jgi:trigger factor